MKKFGNFLLAMLLACFMSCTGDGTTTQNGSDRPVDTSRENTEVTKDPVVPTATPAPERPDCNLSGNVMKENQFWAKSENLIVTIAAVAETEDPNLGESHRMLIVYDGESCREVLKEALPVNLSPDYPYYLSDITYNNVSKVIAIRGFDQVFIFDLDKRTLSDPLVPKYLNERFVDDASSGYIQRLEVWENYLIGYATSMGTFVFDLSQPMSAEAVMPAAEFEMVEGVDYHSLFFLRSSTNANGYQAILPSFDMETGDFTINSFFENPVSLQTNLNRSFRNNRYIVLKELLGGDQSRPVGVDMKAMKKIDIPPGIAAKKDTEIISWMKQQ